MKLFKPMMAFLLVFIMMVGLGIPTFADVPNPDPPDGLVTAPETHTIYVNKLRYENGDVITTVENTGDVMDISSFGTTVEAYNPNLYGPVEFTLYRVNVEDGAIPDNPQALADAVGTAVQNGTNLPYGATVVSASMVDDNGVATFTDIPGGETAYVLVETISPNTVSNRAKPMFLYLPVTNATDDGWLEDVYLYPKNEMTPLNLEFTKFFQLNGEDVVNPLEGANFSLYLRNPDGEDRLVLSDLVTSAEGKFTATNLVVGDYYFVENATNKEGIILDPRVVQGVENLLTFSVNQSGDIIYPDNSLLAEGNQVINFEEPSITKEIVGDEDKIFAVGDAIDYNVTVDIPHNIENYIVFTIRDTHGPNMDIDTDSIKVGDLDGSGYTVTSLATGYEVQFTDTSVLSGLSTLTISYQGALNETAVAGENVTNTAILQWDNGTTSGEEEKSGAEEDSDSARTYSHLLRKVGEGLFDTGIARENLEGAGFVIRNAEGNFLLYVDGDVTWVPTRTEAQVFTTTTDGTILLHGIDVGTYTAIEIIAPDGYALPVDNETDFTVSADVEAGEVWTRGETEIVNYEKVPMPATGLEQAIMVTGGILIILISAVIARVIYKKKQTI